MKITALILLGAALQVSAKGISQNINLSMKEAPLEKVFSAIKNQSDFSFVYYKADLANAKPVTIQVTDMNVNEVLQQVFKDQPLTYTIVDHTIVIRRKLLDIVAKDFPISIDVRGKVVNEKGEPVEGASVKIKGSNSGTSTNSNGEFKLSVSGPDLTLIITGVGFEALEVKINSRTDLGLITVKTKVSPLDEVQIIAYGSTTQRYNIGSVSKVKAEDLTKQPVSNLLAALEAKVPGLQIIQSNGLPGSSFTIQIRGQNTIRKNTLTPLDNPLFIIDGVPFAPQNGNINQMLSLGASGTNNTVSSSEGISPFATLNLADIESVEVLRDADATAIYGSRGANGVILITTRRGRAGKTKVDFNFHSGASKITRSMQMMNTSQYLEMRREAYKNDQLVPTPADAPDLLTFDTTKSTDWKKFLIGNTATTYDANASISGGSSQTQFLIGGNYHKEGYVFIGDFTDTKFSFNTNIQHSNDSKRLNLNFSSMYSYEKNNSAYGIIALRSSYVLPPDYPPLTTSDGGINWKYKGFSLGSGDASNPLISLRQPYFIQSTNLLLNLQLDYRVLKDLTLKSSFGYNTFNTVEHSETPRSTLDPSNINAQSKANFGASDYKTWIIEPQAELKKQIRAFKFNLITGITFQQNQNTSTSISASNFANDALLGSISAAGTVTATSSYSQYKYIAGFSRLSTLLQGKYILNISGRRDGSSRFGPGKKFGNFGSIASGWIFSEEKIIKDKLPILSYGKIHLSYGISGNDNIGNYQYLPNWSITSTTFQGSIGYLPMNLLNPNYSWTVNKKLEAGIQIGILRDQFLIDATWYRNRCNNQLLTYQLPNQTGFSGVTQNFPGLVQNKGWEFQISGTIIKSKLITWNTTINLTIPKNALLSFPNFQTSSYASFYILGKSLNVIRGFKYLGVNDTTGYYQYLTSSGVPTYDPSFSKDQVAIGDRDPKFYGNISNTVEFKGFQLFINLQFEKKLGLNYLGQIASFYMPGIVNNNQPTAVLTRWRNPGDQSAIAQFTTTYNAAGNAASDFYASSGAYSDASFIRFKTISISYRFPNNVIRKLHLQVFRLFANAQNLITLTKYQGNDPESQFFYGVPPLKTFVFGIQVTL